MESGLRRRVRGVLTPIWQLVLPIQSHVETVVLRVVMLLGHRVPNLTLIGLGQHHLTLSIDFYGQHHHSQCENGRTQSFNYDHIGHMHRDYHFRVASRENKVPIFSSSAPAPAGATFGFGTGQNHIYTLTRCRYWYVETFFPWCVLFTWSGVHVTPFVAVHVGFGPECISDLFSISTLMGDSVVARRVYGCCVVLLVIEKL